MPGYLLIRSSARRANRYIQLRGRSRWTVGAVLLSLAVSASIPATAPAASRAPMLRAHALPHCGTVGPYFDGYMDAPPADKSFPSDAIFEGASATVTAQDAALCGSVSYKANIDAAWVMLSSNKGGTGYAQIGLIQRPINGNSQFTCTKWFAQYRDFYSADNGYPTKYGQDCIAPGTVEHLAVLYGLATGDEYMKLNGNVVMTMPSVEFLNWVKPYAPEFMGEATYLADDIPGKPDFPTTFSDLAGQSWFSNNFENLNCSTMFKVNQSIGKPKRTDGETWYDDCGRGPGFEIYTGLAGL